VLNKTANRKALITHVSAIFVFFLDPQKQSVGF